MQPDVTIIGAGLSGLTAALSCEAAGKKVLILESTDRAGGRIKTDQVDGFLLDHGFQVLLSAYEKANEVFDMKALSPGYFAAGAKITDHRGTYRFGDPLRNPSLAFPTLLARAGSLGDKWKIFQLTRQLQSQSAAQMFIPGGLSTHQFLVDYGFSTQIIDNFFVPFFGGIFLERKLETPASMFRFVFRNFALGSACLPAKGMQALPDQLLSRLQNAELRYLTPVEKISKDKSLIHLKSGEELSYNHLIIACDPSHFFAEAKQKYRNTVTMYFAGSSTLQAQNKTIGLDARSDSPVNNFCRHDEVQPECAPEGKSLWSVTVRDGVETTTTAVGQSLAELIQAPANALFHLKTYQIARALPVVDTPRYDLTAEETRYDSRIFLAGDYLLNGSIEAALLSGARAAEAVIRSAENQ